MKYSKDFSKGIGFGRMGRYAYQVHKVWRLGVHIFVCDGRLIFRVCYLRTRNATHYFQAFITIKKSYEIINDWSDEDGRG